MLSINLLILIFSIFCISINDGRIIHYYFDEDNEERVNECIINAIDHLTEETCLQFVRSQVPKDSILFLDSGHCSWQETNNTVHLGVNCINDAMCSQIIARALTNDRPYPLVSRILNLKYNCTDKCTILCENGGSITGDCTCECGYGFTGDRCERLKGEALFTDTSCGIRDDDDDGTIALSSFPGNAPKQTYCQWLIKADEPWENIEFEIVELDLDNENLLPSQKCGDSFVIFGSSSVQNPIPCNSEGSAILGQKYRSDSNWLFIELRANAYSLRQHKGPLIKYNVVNEDGPNNIRTFSSEQVSTSTSTFIASFWTLLMTAIFRIAH
uniref:CUB domain-containing protein n=1 Tax=Acrobeloides nanus TaxID=290746 RepID=A0A914EC39_9BILA